MAQITAKDNSSILKIKSFLGLNENPDGDTTLKVGEMAEMRNFRVTQDKHLQIRPGSKTILSLADALSALSEETTGGESETRVYGVWRGIVGASEHILAVYGGHIWDIDAEIVMVQPLFCMFIPLGMLPLTSKPPLQLFR